MEPIQSKPQQPSLADWPFPDPQEESEPINYRFRRKASLLVRMGKELIRLEAYGARLLEDISLEN